MKIYLIGFMGSGKSTAGKKMASLLNVPFFDIDNEVEKISGTSIPELFEKGEDVFRDFEKNALQRVLAVESAVVSTGGGTPCYFDNMKLMTDSGITVYLRLDPISLANRLSNSKRPRPMLAGLTEDQLLDYIRVKLAEREPIYKQSRYMVRGEDLDVRSLIENIRDGESQLR